jgi:polysaccharide biosynthesis protein PslH
VSDILFLAHRVPYPPNRGDKIRSWHLLKAIAKLAPVHVCALWDDERDLAHIDVLRGVAKSVHLERADPSKLKAMATALRTGGSASVAACASDALQAAVDAVLRDHPISTIFAYSGQMAQFVPAGTHRFVMDFVDMDSAKFAAFGGFANRQEAKRLFAFETATAQRADLSLFVSDAEASLFRRETGLGPDKVSFIENGIDLDRFDPSHPRGTAGAGQGPLIVFTGQMDYRPNIEAVAAFARETMPMVRARIGDARFVIVGRAPTDEVLALAALPGVSVSGEVPDTRDWLAAADLVVAPLKLARGIQNKVLEAMAMAKAVIASPAAAEGIDAVPGEELVIADGAAAEAEAVRTLLANPAQATEIGAAARARMKARYSWDARLAGLPAILGLAS